MTTILTTTRARLAGALARVRRVLRTKRARANVAQLTEFAALGCGVGGVGVILGVGFALLAAGVALYVIAQGLEPRP